MSKRFQSGYSLLEILTVVAIIGTIAAVTVPAFGTIQRRAALRAAASELRGIFHVARSRAISRHVNCGVKFSLVGGEWQYALYDDGDGDGVRNDDISRGIDRRASESRPALRESRAVSIGVIDRSFVDPDGERTAPSASPVRFNRSSICSFSPFGESTPGTIYLTDRGDQLYAVRVYGNTASIRTLRYEVKSGRWVSR